MAPLLPHLVVADLNQYRDRQSRGVPVNDVQAVMGHEKPSATPNLYTHRSGGRDKHIRDAFADDPLISSDT